ncbi:MAG: tetrahydromethanopterin S-methyltransferase subunit H [Thermincola sp.]|jgi:tetrahydromethanopterin S-methyltransferase subunit H|nr:tetrahydromethanopterin S-methyltransferase subunit H [Thermincola sp.]MDT3702234.1 tetrahydromethanopterin S-methyltransferase subunit H [Thermincola sp.]
MFKLENPQKVCQIGNFKVGGQYGENPPLLISSMFHNGDKVLESRKEGKWDKAKAEEYVKRQEELEDKTGIPAIVAMVGNSVEEMARYIDWFTSISDRPFGIDMWMEKPRLEAAEYVAKKGLQDRLVYNSITPWDKDIPGQVKALKELGIKHVIVQAYDVTDPSPKGRLTSFNSMMESIKDGGFESILVDTSVMNLPAIAFSGEANRIIKEATGWPSGVASSNGTYMWKAARELFGNEGFAAMNAAGQGCSALYWTDFIFYGPIVAAPKMFPAVISGAVMAATMAFHETGNLPTNENHPLYKFFGDFAEKLKAGDEQSLPVHE